MQYLSYRLSTKDNFKSLTIFFRYARCLKNQSSCVSFDLPLSYQEENRGDNFAVIHNLSLDQHFSKHVNSRRSAPICIFFKRRSQSYRVLNGIWFFWDGSLTPLSLTNFLKVGLILTTRHVDFAFWPFFSFSADFFIIIDQLHLYCIFARFVPPFAVFLHHLETF